ncbi:MAG: metalloregulator ArsR/SmtB family transcription factor [Pirellulaceae bacterium]
MPFRVVAARELADFMRAVAHPRRIQILEELRSGECDVATLAKATSLAQANVSQQLMVLRAHRVVAERREGRHVYYRLRSLELADWLRKGMDYLPPMDEQAADVRLAIKKAQDEWSQHE